MTLSPSQRFVLINHLNNLVQAEFETVLIALKVPNGVVSSIASAQGNRVAELMRWIDSPNGHDIEQLLTVLGQIGTLPSELQNPISSVESRAEAVIILSARLSADNKIQLEGKKIEVQAFLLHLEKTIGHQCHLTIKDIEMGSIKITLEGSLEDLKNLEALIQSGDLTEVLGIRIENFYIKPETVSAPTFSLSTESDQTSNDVTKITAIADHDGKMIETLPPRQKRNLHHPNAQKLSIQERLQLIDLLNELPLSQLMTTETALSVPNEGWQGMEVPQGIRVNGLLQWLEGPTGKGLDALLDILATLDMWPCQNSEHDTERPLKSDDHYVLNVKLEGNVHEINEDELKEILQAFQTVAVFDGLSIQINKIQSGSIDIQLSGTRAALRSIHQQVENNQLSEINGRAIQQSTPPTKKRKKTSLNLSGADLSGEDLRNLNLSGADFSGANLIQADFSRASLIQADFSRASLIQADFSGANLIQADFSDANLNNANLSKANLNFADLIGADLHNTNLHNANLHNTNLYNASLSDADLSDANLRNANFHKADLHKADLHKADLSIANLRNANLRNADLNGATLINTNLNSANLSKANLSKANLHDANFYRANLGDANLRSTNLRSANFYDANLSGTIMIGSRGLSDTQIENFKSRGAIFEEPPESHHVIVISGV